MGFKRREPSNGNSMTLISLSKVLRNTFFNDKSTLSNKYPFVYYQRGRNLYDKKAFKES